jgi:uncharacterized protein (DUF305 family)
VDCFAHVARRQYVVVPELLDEAVPEPVPRHIDTFARYVNNSHVIARRCLPLLLIALSATACSGSEPPPAPPPAVAASAFGGTDRAWVEINIAMAEELTPLLTLAETKTKDPAVRALAAEITAGNQRELQLLYQLHDAAGLPPENPHKGMPMPGMVTPELVTKAAATSGAAFDELLRKQLREHMEQGVRLATSEGTAGVEPQTKALAAQMIADRDAYLPRLSSPKK